MLETSPYTKESKSRRDQAKVKVRQNSSLKKRSNMWRLKIPSLL